MNEVTLPMRSDYVKDSATLQHTKLRNALTQALQDIEKARQNGFPNSFRTAGPGSTAGIETHRAFQKELSKAEWHFERHSGSTQRDGSWDYYELKIKP